MTGSFADDLPYGIFHFLSLDVLSCHPSNLVLSVLLSPHKMVQFMGELYIVVE